MSPLSHDRRRGRAWHRLLSRSVNPLRHSSPKCAGPPHHRRCRVSRPCLRGQAARQAVSAGPKNEEKNSASTTASEEEEEEPARKKREIQEEGGRALRVSVLYGAGLRPSLRPLLRPVLGSTSLRGISRSLSKGGVPSLRPPHAVHPPIASEPPRPSRHTSRGEKGRENPRTLVGFSSTCHTPAFSDPFQRGKGRSVVRGGWRSECGEW